MHYLEKRIACGDDSTFIDSRNCQKVICSCNKVTQLRVVKDQKQLWFELNCRDITLYVHGNVDNVGEQAHDTLFYCE